MNDLMHTKKGRKNTYRLPRLAAMQMQLALTLESIGLPAADAPTMLAALREVRDCCAYTASDKAVTES
jgi:hypothetical protein